MYKRQVPDRPGLAFKIFSKLAAKNINVDIILQSIGRNGTKDISFTVSHDNLKETIDLLNPYVDLIGATSVVYDENVAKVSAVGAGMETHPGIAAAVSYTHLDVYKRQAANDVIEIAGILNGTTNFILTKMIHDSMDFQDALALSLIHI